jgi:hypothetical protein
MVIPIDMRGRVHCITARITSKGQVEKKIGAMDFILDASGIAELEFNPDALALTGIYMLTGIPGGDRPLQIPGAELVRQLVLDNQVMLGSVNAARGHFTNRFPWDQFAGLIGPTSARCNQGGHRVGALIKAERRRPGYRGARLRSNSGLVPRMGLDHRQRDDGHLPRL